MVGSVENVHPDAQVAHALDEVAAKIVEHIRHLKPDVVITFDPIGGYRHPDHIHVQRATTMAFERADDSAFHPESGAPFKPRALYYHVFPHQFLRIVTRIMPFFGADPRKWGRNKDIDLKALTEFEFPIHVKIDFSEVSEIKAKAGACHASQGGIQMRRGLMGVVTRALGEHDNYMRAFPPVRDRSRTGRDLFDGI
jgi:LmbE family N-acetylglucosaminyl deacetylase